MHDPVTAGLAIVISIASMQVVFLLQRRVAECAVQRQPLWLVTGAVVGGMGIWSTHFLAMLAYRSAGPLDFDWTMTLMSALIAVAGMFEVLTLLARPERGKALLAGLLLAATVAAMHFMGMWSMKGLIRHSYDYSLLLVAVAISTVLFVSAFRIVPAPFARGPARCLPGLLVVAGITLMHFADMAAATFMVDASVAHAVDETSRLVLVGALCAVSTLLASGSVAAVFIDRHLTDLRGLQEASIEGLAIVRDNRVIDANSRFAEVLALDAGATRAEGRDLDSLLQPLDAAPVLAPRERTAEARLMAGPAERIVEFAVRTVEYRGRPCQVIAVRDLTASHQAKQRIEHLASHDALTNLANRTLLEQRLCQAITVAGEARASVAVLALDLDRFKAVNDMHGHSAGDDVLRRVARILRDCANDHDSVARIGGDEFVIVQSAQSQPKAADQLARAIQKAFRREFNTQANSLAVGVSIGIALFPDDAQTPETLRHCADIALYRAKSEGRGTVAHYSAEMDQDLQQRRRIEAELRLAIRRKQLRLNFQPLVKTESGAVVGYEALLRWRHPELGEVPPSTFIPIAEESNAILSIGEWVLRQACRTAVSWPDGCSVAVNVSAIQFARANFADKVFDILRETGLEPERLEIEVTETVLLQDEAQSRAILNQLKAGGVRIVIDDFGTGYSSLSNLRTFQFDKIKIDRSFIATMETDRHARAIVRSVADLGRNINVPVLAEGVETAAQGEMIRADGCTHAQGYYYGRPVEDIAAAAHTSGSVISLAERRSA
ncbi:hypothetical protein VE26_10640 [Devosia chinhatensis]|uniref:Diguanylate phosphodiesterase n=2 Tax=Devosia chinhatensis TaxID=429727 RepID=A0A0F5FI18_9HYPH|nr:hypothetical protein VE26_10640 [Devosia chinhatensis]